MKFREENDPSHWTVPYLPINPQDVGRTYDSDVIRINSQSGKGGVSYILEQSCGLKIPVKMREDLGYAVKAVSDVKHKELHPDEIFEIFERRYKGYTPVFDVVECHFKQLDGGIEASVTVKKKDSDPCVVVAKGKGRIDAVSNALADYFGVSCDIDCYEEHALKQGSASSAIAYVGVAGNTAKEIFFGVGIDHDIIRASIDALVSAMNKRLENK